MPILQEEIDLAQQLLDASRDQLTHESYAERNAKLFRARAPRVAFMTRKALIEEAVEGLGRTQEKS